MQIQTESALDELRTLRDCIRWGASRFGEAGLVFGHGTDNAIDEAVWLVLHALSLPPDLADAWHDCRLTRDERAAVIHLLEQRILSRKPVPYLTGEAWFCRLPFNITEDVLVPRSPVAELIESGFSPWLEGVDVRRVLDLCTGSGCIGIACAHLFPDARVDITDISAAALKVAESNIKRHHLAGRVEAIASDLFDQIPARRYDLIISNPPYVDAEAMRALPEEYRQEPELALAAGADGLDAVRKILHDARGYLGDQGILIVEVGDSQAALVKSLPNVPFLWIEFERGGHGVFLLDVPALRAIDFE